MATANAALDPNSRRARRMQEEGRASAAAYTYIYWAKRSLWQTILAAAVVLALMGGSFGLGWHFGVDSTRYKGGILLVNEDNPLSADYVPEALVNLYEERHSFRLARSDIYVTRETYEAMEAMFAAAEDDNVNGFIVTSGYRDYQRRRRSSRKASPATPSRPEPASTRPASASTSPPRRMTALRAPSNTPGCARTPTNMASFSAIRPTRRTSPASATSHGTTATSASRPPQRSASRISRWKNTSAPARAAVPPASAVGSDSTNTHPTSRGWVFCVSVRMER